MGRKKGNHSVLWSTFVPNKLYRIKDENTEIDANGDISPHIYLSHDIVSDSQSNIWVRSADGTNEGVCVFSETIDSS